MNSLAQHVTEPLLTAKDVAERLQMSAQWVRDHATSREPRLPAVRLGGRRAKLRFRPEDVDAFIQKHMVATEDVR